MPIPSNTNFDGTVILLTESIGEAIIALPALHAMEAELRGTNVLLVTSAFIKGLLRREFENWFIQTPNQAKGLISCQTLIDTRCLNWSADWITGVHCKKKIGLDLRDKSVLWYDSLIPWGPFNDDTSACEIFNPFARFLNPDARIESIPKLKSSFLSDGVARIGIVPGAGCIAKRWPLNHFLFVEKWAHANGIETVWFLGPKESDLKSNPSLRTAILKSGLEASALLEALGSCCTVISNDTALMHLSAAIGVATIGIFGPSLPSQWFPYRPPSKAIQHKSAGSEKGVITNIHSDYKYWPEPDCLTSELENLCNDRSQARHADDKTT
jgi:hypothetical protein